MASSAWVGLFTDSNDENGHSKNSSGRVFDAATHGPMGPGPHVAEPCKSKLCSALSHPKIIANPVCFVKECDESDGLMQVFLGFADPEGVSVHHRGRQRTNYLNRTKAVKRFFTEGLACGPQGPRHRPTDAGRDSAQCRSENRRGTRRPRQTGGAPDGP